MSNLKHITLTILTLLTGVSVSLAQTKAEHETQKRRLEKEIAQIDAQLKQISARSSSATYKLGLINKKVENRKALVQQSDRQIRNIDHSIYLKQSKINKLTARVDTLETSFNKLIRSAYKNRDAKVWYMYLLASDNMSQAYRRYGYFKNMASQIKDEATKIEEAELVLNQEREQLRGMREEAEAVRMERKAELVKINADQVQAQKVVSLLQKDRRTYQNQLSAKKREVEALNRQIEKFVRDAMKAGEPSVSSSKNVSKTHKPIDYKLTGKFSSNKGKLPWPVEGPVVDRFGQHYHPVYTRLKLPFNNGISIAVAEGTDVIAVFDGVVKQIVVMPGYNQCVLVQHGGYFSFYCKLKNTKVKAGDTIKLGQVIGEVDSINSESQLHFQIWKGTQPQNPQSWLLKN